MRHHAASLVLLITLAGASACAGDLPTGASVGADPVSLERENAAERPIHGSCSTESVEVISFAPPILQQRSTAACRVSHIGLMRVVNTQTINVATGAQAGTAVMTAANGDALYASSLGTATPTGPTTIVFTGTATIAGGTGRFAEAAGELNVQGWADNAASTGEHTYDGWIHYDAAARAER